MRKFAIFLIYFAVLLSFISCSGQSKKDTAYCFSIVFEKQANIPTVTMYCKIHNDDENGKMSDTSFGFSADTFTSALEKSTDHSHEIYFNSTKAVYFSNDIPEEEKEQIIVYFLNNTKYQSSIYTYAHENQAADISFLHSRALEVCKNEKINHYEKNNYKYALKIVRDKK